jgi:hypothetical protein
MKLKKKETLYGNNQASSHEKENYGPQTVVNAEIPKN